MTNRWLRCEGQAGKFGTVEDVMDNSLDFLHALSESQGLNRRLSILHISLCIYINVSVENVQE